MFLFLLDANVILIAKYSCLALLKLKIDGLPRLKPVKRTTRRLKLMASCSYLKL